MVPVLLLNGRKTAVLAADNILQGKRIAVTIRLERVRERKLACTLALLPKIHQQLVLDAFGGVCRQPDILIRLKGVHGFNQPDRADGQQIVLLRTYGVILFYNMRYQSKIVLDQLFTCLGVPVLLHAAQQNRLLIGRERLGKRSVRALYTQHKEEKCAAERK